MTDTPPPGFAERLVVARARKKQTLRDIANLCGVSQAAVHKWERGVSMCTSGNLIKIADHLDVSVEWLLDPEPLDFESTDRAPQGRHAKYWVREAIAELKELGVIQ